MDLTWCSKRILPKKHTTHLSEVRGQVEEGGGEIQHWGYEPYLRLCLWLMEAGQPLEPVFIRTPFPSVKTSLWAGDSSLLKSEESSASLTWLRHPAGRTREAWGGGEQHGALLDILGSRILQAKVAQLSNLLHSRTLAVLCDVSDCTIRDVPLRRRVFFSPHKRPSVTAANRSGLPRLETLGDILSCLAWHIFSGHSLATLEQVLALIFPLLPLWLTPKKGATSTFAGRPPLFWCQSPTPYVRHSYRQKGELTYRRNISQVCVRNDALLTFYCVYWIVSFIAPHSPIAS